MKIYKKHYNVGLNNPKHLKCRSNLSLIKHFNTCINCGTNISKGSKLGRCRSCSKLGNLHPMFGKEGMKGSKNPNYVHGKSYLPYTPDFSERLKNLFVNEMTINVKIAT